MPVRFNLFSTYPLQFLLLAIGILLVLLYVGRFDDPLYSSLVPVAYWFFLLSYWGVLWLLRTVSKEPDNRRQTLLALGIAAIATLTLYLAGHVSEQKRQNELQERHLSD